MKKNEDECYDDYCYECSAYGDDYYLDEHGEWVSRCSDCPFNPSLDENWE